MLLVGKSYRVLTPDDVAPVMENVVSTVKAVFPIGLWLMVILYLVYLLPHIIRTLSDKEFRAGLKYFISNGYNALVARLHIIKKRKKGTK